MRFNLTAVLCLMLATPPTLAQTTQLANPTAAPAYQFMHVRYVGNRIYFSPAYQGQEAIKVTDFQRERFTLFDEKQLGWEAMSRLLTDLSGQGWELVSVLAENDKDGSQGAIYLLRRLK